MSVEIPITTPNIVVTVEPSKYEHHHEQDKASDLALGAGWVTREAIELLKWKADRDDEEELARLAAEKGLAASERAR